MGGPAGSDQGDKKMKWHNETQEGVCASSEIFRWYVEQQYTIDGGMEVRLWVVITTGKRRSSAVMGACRLMAHHLDDLVVIVTLAEVRQKAEAGDHSGAQDLLELLATM